MKRVGEIRRTPTRSRPRDTGPSLRTVTLVTTRDFGKCAVCGESVVGTRGYDWSVHHRVRRGAGSTRREWVNQPANLLLMHGHGSAGCHAEVESRRVWAEGIGLIVRDGVTLPAERPVRHAAHGLWVWLDNDGGLRVVGE